MVHAPVVSIASHTLSNHDIACVAVLATAVVALAHIIERLAQFLLVLVCFARLEGCSKTVVGV